MYNRKGVKNHSDNEALLSVEEIKFGGMIAKTVLG